MSSYVMMDIVLRYYLFVLSRNAAMVNIQLVIFRLSFTICFVVLHRFVSHTVLL